MRWGTILLAIIFGFILLYGAISIVNRTGTYLIIHDMEGYQEIYEIVPHGSSGYMVLGSTSFNGGSSCFIGLLDSAGFIVKDTILAGPSCSASRRGDRGYLVRMFDTLLLMDEDLEALWRIYVDNKTVSDITDLMDEYRDRYYYGFVSGNAGVVLLDTSGHILDTFLFEGESHVVILEVDTCGHIHLAFDDLDGRVVVMRVDDGGNVLDRISLDFSSIFRAERGIPVALIWRKGMLYLFADAIREEMSSPVFVTIEEGDTAFDYGRIDGRGSVGDAIPYSGGIVVGYNMPWGGFLLRFFDGDMNPVWSLKSGKGVLMSMTEGPSGRIVMAGNVPEEGNFFSAFASEDGKWITR